MIEIARRFAAYIPATLVRQILTDGLPALGEPRPLLAATVFSDISGFTKMSEELASDGPRGAEELNRVLLTTFTAMIDLIHEMGGAVSHFYGDAMLVYFPETEAGDAALRSLICAQMMQKLMMSSFARAVTNRPPGKDPIFPLTIKIGVSYGRCQEIVVGEIDHALEFVLTGTAVDQAAMAEKIAQSGQVVASATVLAQAGLVHLCADGEYCLLTEPIPMTAAHPILDWPLYGETALTVLTEAAAAFIPAAIAHRLERGGSGEIAEHRPVTSLFVDFDFVGDVDDASDVETAVHGQQLHDYYLWAMHIVSRFGEENAHVNRILTGDKGNQLHIIFGAPVAPDAPEQAIRCAMTLIREKPAFIAQQRIGLAAGKVFAGPVGSTTRREYTVVGDVVNLSARLAQACQEDCVYTNSGTAGRVENWIDFEVLSPVLLKGRQEAVSPYRPLGEQTGLTPLQVYFTHWERPLVGRDAELDLLLGGMDAALHKIGGVAAILGAVGVGKTRLLAEGIRYWLDKGGTGVVGVAQQHTSDVPYGPWLNIWRDFFNLRVDMSLAVQAEHVVAQTKALLPDVGNDIALWGDVLGLPIPGQEHLAELSAEVKQARFFALVRRCFLAYAELTPLLVILEDAHWADRSSLALLDEVTKNLDDHALFFAVTFRLVEELTMEMLNRASCVPILLADLSPTHARAMLTHLLGVAQLPLAVEQHLGLRDREGRDSPVSPLFLEESVNMMVGAGVLKMNGDIHVDEELLQTLQIPDTIHGLLLARLDRLPPAGRDLLQVASVIGRQFALEPLHSIAADLPQQQISILLEDLSSEDITRLVTSDPEWIYLFQHALTHEVAYESLPYARRQALHQAMADWIVNQNAPNLRSFYSILAYHYSQAGNHEAGLKYALAAGLDARDLFSNQEALEFFNLAEKHLQALGEEDHWETAVELYLSRSEVQIIVGDLSSALANVEKSILLSHDESETYSSARACTLMAEINYRQGQFEKVQQWSNKLIVKADNVSPEQLIKAFMWAGWAASSTRDYEQALTYLHRAESLCDRYEDNILMARVLEALSFTYYSLKNLESALDVMRHGVQYSRKYSTPVNVGIAMSNIAFVQLTLGEAEAALESIYEAVNLGRQSGMNLLAHALGNRAAIYSYLGIFDKALLDFQEVTDLLIRMDYSNLLVEAYVVWGLEYYCVLRQWEDARQKFENAQKLIADQPDRYPEEQIRLDIGMAQVELKNGSIQKSSNLLVEVLSRIHQFDADWWLPSVYHLLGEVNLAQNKEEEAIIYFQKGIASAKQKGCPDYLPLSLLEMAKLQTDKDRRYRFLSECIDVAEKRARFSDRIFCLESAGQLLIEEEDSNMIKLGQKSMNLAKRLKQKSPDNYLGFDDTMID